MPLAKTKFYLEKKKCLLEKTQALELENDQEITEVGRLEKRVSDLEQHMNPDLRTPLDQKQTFRECSACEARVFNELENTPVIRELQDQVEKYRYCMLECKNQNLLLKRDLHIAKKVVCQELGIESVDFPALMRHASEEGWKGRREKILLLQNKNFELRDKLQNKESNKDTMKQSPSEEYARQNIDEDRKTYWRLELEKRKAFEMAGKEKDDLVEELLSVRKKFQNCKARNRELLEEIRIIRGELYAIAEKNREETGLILSMRTVEQQLKESMHDRSELRRLWDGAKGRNQILDDQVALLKEQASVLKDKNNEDCQIIQALTNQQQRLQTMLETEQMLNHQQAEQYKSDLRRMQANHANNITILKQLQFALDEKSSLIETLQQQIADNTVKLERRRSLQEETAELEVSESQESRGGGKDETELPEGEEGEEEDEGEIEKQKFKEMQMEIAKYKTLYETTKNESNDLAERLSDLYETSDNRSKKLVEIQRLALERDMECKELKLKVQKLQEEAKDKKKKKAWKKAKPPAPIAKTKAEELSIKLEVMSEENDFLRNFLSTAIASKQEDFSLYRTVTEQVKENFEASINEIKAELAHQEETPGDDEEGGGDEEEEEDDA